MSNAFVVLMGMGVVFIGLICIVLLVSLTGKIVQNLEKNTKKPSNETETDASPSVSTQSAVSFGPIPNRSELVAAISAVLAEELGTTVQGIRICSLKRAGGPVYNRGELVAAVSAAIAEEMGTQPSGIRIVSMKKI